VHQGRGRSFDRLLSPYAAKEELLAAKMNDEQDKKRKAAEVSDPLF
jgi:hypothetical protein